MDNPKTHEIRALSPCNSTRRRNKSHSNSPEFEFWMVRNPSFPQPNLLSADELFFDGVLLPLHLLSDKPSHPPDLNPYPGPKPSNKGPGEEEAAAGPEADAGPDQLRHVSADLCNGLTSSKRWKDIFKKGDKNSLAKNVAEDKEKEKRREKKCQRGASSAELNINIWPFSRSRSAGNSGSRPRMVSGAPGTPKVSSAPCSRSNSAGESKSRKWPSSPGRPGVHLGRSSPIWQVKRGGGGGGGGRGSSGLARNSEAAVRNVEKVGTNKDTRGKLAGNGSSNNNNKARGLNSNVNVNEPMCIGYRTSDEISAIGGGGGGGVSIGKSGSSCGGGGNNSGNYLFNFRSLFTRKVY